MLDFETQTSKIQKINYFGVGSKIMFDRALFGSLDLGYPAPTLPLNLLTCICKE